MSVHADHTDHLEQVAVVFTLTKTQTRQQNDNVWTPFLCSKVQNVPLLDQSHPLAPIIAPWWGCGAPGAAGADGGWR